MGIGLFGLGPQAFELKVLQVGAVLAGEGLWKLGGTDAAGVLGHWEISSKAKGLHA